MEDRDEERAKALWAALVAVSDATKAVLYARGLFENNTPTGPHESMLNQPIYVELEGVLEGLASARRNLSDHLNAVVHR